MIHRFFQWRARRQLARPRYRIDRRHYHGRFRAGFVSHLKQANFWESDRDPKLRRRRGRRRVLLVLGAALLLFLLWGLSVSVGAFQVF